MLPNWVPGSMELPGLSWLSSREVATPPTAMSFRDFVARVRPQYQWYRYCGVLADALQSVADGIIKRLMVFIAPRHGKSELCSRLFSAYYVYRYPEQWVGMTSYSADLSYSFSRAARDNYTRAGGAVRDDAAAVKYWMTPHGGGLWAAGVGGPLTGRGGDLLLIDDPLKNAEEASSSIIRQKHQDWYESTFYTRAEPGAAIVIVQTRWHDADLSGYLLASEADAPEHWHIINLPALAEPQPSFPDTCTVAPDWRKDGEALCPERYPREKLERIARRLGGLDGYYWSALYQQRPRPKDGALFKRGWLQVVGALPNDVQRVRYWDTAGADAGTRGDYSVGCLMARDSRGVFYIEDVVRGQWTAHERNQVIVQTAALDQQRLTSVTTYIEQPPGLAKESTDAIIRALAGYRVVADKVSGDKVSRAEPFAAQCQAGNVRILAGKWNSALLDEIESFPFGRNDDSVDASSGAFNKLVALGRSVIRADVGTQRNRWAV
jgi:predicted phage terminase large subunit-like protein